MARQASVLVCDDLLVSLTGKFLLHGVYTGDIVIPSDPTMAVQLVFLFIVETEIDDLFEQIQLQITLPGQATATLDVPVTPMGLPPPGRTRWFAKFPFLLQQPALRPGRIEARVVHEKGEIPAAVPWISLAQQTPPVAS